MIGEFPALFFEDAVGQILEGVGHFLLGLLPQRYLFRRIFARGVEFRAQFGDPGLVGLRLSLQGVDPRLALPHILPEFIRAPARTGRAFFFNRDLAREAIVIPVKPGQPAAQHEPHQQQPKQQAQDKAGHGGFIDQGCERHVLHFYLAIKSWSDIVPYHFCWL